MPKSRSYFLNVKKKPSLKRGKAQFFFSLNEKWGTMLLFIPVKKQN